MGFLHACRNAETYNYPSPLPSWNLQLDTQSTTVPLTTYAIQMLTPRNQIIGFCPRNPSELCPGMAGDVTG